MPIPANVAHVIMGGGLPGGERWNAGFWTKNGDTPPDAQSIADDWADNLNQTALANALRNIWSTGTTLRTVDVYAYGAGGALDNQASTTDASYDGNSTQSLPNQTALCVTMRTAQSGRRGRGRMYLPGTGLTISQESGLCGSGDVSTLMNALGAAFALQAVVVVSQRAGASYALTRIDADRVADSQNGRRRQLDSARLGYNLT